MEEGDRQERNNFGENRSEILFFFFFDKIESCIFQEKEFEKYTV